MWITIAISGYVLLALVALLDKIIVSKEKVNPLKFTFFSAVIMAPFIVVAAFFTPPQNFTQWFVVIIGGISYTLALYSMYRAYAVGEVSHNGPLIGALTPVATFIVTWFFLPEVLTGRQLGAIGFLILGSLIISVKNTGNGVEALESLGFSILASLFFAVFFVSAKYSYTEMGFGPGIIYLSAVLGICGLLMFIFPSVRREIFKKRFSIFKKRPPLALIATDKLAAGSGVALIQYAVSQGSPTVVNALTGLQYGVLVIIIAVLTKWKPKLFKENYAIGEAAQETFAVIFIGIGLVLLVI